MGIFDRNWEDVQVEVNEIDALMDRLRRQGC
jgi:hypothetical protein